MMVFHIILPSFWPISINHAPHYHCRRCPMHSPKAFRTLIATGKYSQ